MTMSLFAESQEQSDRMAAIDQLHAATAIYTAQPVVDQLLERLQWPSMIPRRCLDPSAGDGQFVCRALEHALSYRAFSDAELVDSLQAWEVHPAACWQARSRVASLLQISGRSKANAESLALQIVHNRDFLTSGPLHDQRFDLIIGNPPYLRKVNVPLLLRQDYERHVPDYASGDLLHSFLDSCSKLLTEGGEIGMVVSDRWLFNAGASKLRASLGAQQLGMESLERLDVDSVFYRPKQRRAGTLPRVHPVQIHLRRGHISPLTSAPIYPGADTERYAGLPTLGDIATIRICPWLGSPGIFIVSHAVAAAAGLPADILVPAVDTDDIKDGILGEPKRYAILTRPDVQPCDAVMEHLERNMMRMAPRGRTGKKWMPPESFHGFDLTKHSLLVPRIAKRPTAVRLKPNVLPVNHNISVIAGDPETLARVERALNSDLAAQWVREHAAPLENSFYSITTTILRKLPVGCD